MCTLGQISLTTKQPWMTWLGLGGNQMWCFLSWSFLEPWMWAGLNLW